MPLSSWSSSTSAKPALPASEIPTTPAATITIPRTTAAAAACVATVWYETNAERQISQVLELIKKEWPAMCETDSVPVQLAMQLLDTSSVGASWTGNELERRAHEYRNFQRTHKYLQRRRPAEEVIELPDLSRGPTAAGRPEECKVRPPGAMFRHWRTDLSIDGQLRFN